MEQAAAGDRVIVVCTENYMNRANQGLEVDRCCVRPLDDEEVLASVYGGLSAFA